VGLDRLLYIGGIREYSIGKNDSSSVRLRSWGHKHLATFRPEVTRRQKEFHLKWRYQYTLGAPP